MAAPILMVDTYSVFFRAFHALPPMSTRAGEPTSALYGFSALLLKLLREHRGAALVFAVDGPGPTFRHEAYGDYKAGRNPVPDALSTQLRRLPQFLDAAGAPSFKVPGFEADDVLATLGRRARDAGDGALVVSGDRDLLQLARGSVLVNFIGRRGKDAVVYDEAAVRERFGVPPSKLAAYMALVGDPSDNIPSVPGIGPSTARKLLAEAASCTELLDSPPVATAARVRDILRAHHEQILRSEALARLREDAPLGGAGPFWSIPSAASLGALRLQFQELEFSSLLPRLDRLLE